MVTDHQVRRLFKLMPMEETFETAAVKAGMDAKTARKYRRLGRLPGEVAVTHNWRTREDPFGEVWEEVRQELAVNPGLQAKTLFGALQRKYPGRFQDGQVRTLQRRIKTWRALEGPAQEVFFSQVHEPGRLGQSDFTHLSDLGISKWRRDLAGLSGVESSEGVAGFPRPAAKYWKWAIQMGEATFHRRRWVLVIIGVPVLVLLVLMSGLVGWFDLNSVHEDVDIATGRVKRTRYLFYCKISEKIEESVVSKALPHERLAAAQPEWHRVNTFCGLNVISPHYAFHSALSDLHRLAEAQSLISFTEEAKRQVADQVLQLWRSSNGDYEAGEYIMAVYQKAGGLHPDGKVSMSLADLPGDQHTLTAQGTGMGSHDKDHSQ